MLKRSLKKLRKTESNASNGWLESFRKRHQIVFNELCGESSDVNSETTEEWIAKLPSIIQGYEPENIAKGDETGLFFRALPNKLLCLKGEKCSGGKLCKERLTIFLCGFMSGEMEKPLLIGKAAKQRYFRNLDIRKIPVEWRTNKKAWITSQIMEEWLTAFSDRIKMQNQHVFCSWITQHATSISNCPTCDLFGSLQTPLAFLSQRIRASFGMLKSTIVNY